MTSVVWKFFTKCSEDVSKAQCSICNKKISKGGRNSRTFTPQNLKSHLMIEHKNEFMKVTANKKKRKVLPKSDSETGSEEEVDLTVVQASKVCQEVSKPTFLQNKIQQSKVYQPTISSMFESKAPLAYINSRALHITDLIAKTIAKDQLPFYQVEKQEIIKLPTKEHTHDSESIEIEAEIIVTKMKRRAIETTETTSTIINECVNGLTQSAKGILQNNEALRKMIRRKRNEVNSAPAAPIDLKTLQLPEIYKTYSPNDEINEQFLLADSGQESDRVLIFGRLSGLKILKNSRTWYCDGTFRIAPLLFSQVYVILAEALGGVHPIMYALLPSKKASVYEKLLIMLKTLEPDLNVATETTSTIINECVNGLTQSAKKWIPSIIHLTCIFAGNVDKMTYSSSIPGLSWSSNIVGWNLQGSTGNFFIG
ncbi:hypothetical protein QTP88_023741 [Uroleucon formosanum]